jgi:flagellin
VVFGTSQTLGRQVSMNQSIVDGLTSAGAMVSAASSAVNQISSLMTKMASAITTAQSNNTDGAALQATLTGYMSAISSLVSESAYSGVNLLDGTTLSTQILSSANGSNLTYLQISGQNLTTGANGGLNALATAIADIGTGALSATDFSNLSSAVSTATNTVSSAASSLGMTSDSISAQTNLLQAVNSDMTSAVKGMSGASAASTQLSAVQAQQLLVSNMLATMNKNNSDMIKELFGIKSY